MIFQSICIVIALAAQITTQAVTPEACLTLGVAEAAPTTYQKCPNSNMCCRTNDRNPDACITEGPLAGLCKSMDFDIWRESCTDWTSDKCVRLCVDNYVGKDNRTINRGQQDYTVTQCEDGSICCGQRGSPEYGDCCRSNRGVYLENLKVVTTRPASMSPIASSPASTSSCPAQSALPSAGSKSYTGAIVGGVIGGLVAGIAATVVALWSLQRHRKGKTPHGNELEDTNIVTPEKYAMHAELPYHERNAARELHGGPQPVELAER